MSALLGLSDWGAPSAFPQISARYHAHRFILNRRHIVVIRLQLFVLVRAFKIGGFVRKLKADAHPVAGVEITFIKTCIEQRPEISSFIDEIAKPVKMLRDREYLIERGRGIDTVEQGQSGARVETGVGGFALLARPDGRFAFDRSRHQLISHTAAREEQGRFPAEIEAISARAAAQRISRRERLPHRRCCLCHDAMIRQMRQKRRAPPGRPAIGTTIITQPHRRRP